MNNLIEFDGIKFWVDQNIIYCELHKDFDFPSLKGGISEIFDNAITTLSNGKYFPILINLKELGNIDCIKLFKFFSQNTLINTSVLSKAYVVRTIGLKSLLTIYAFVFSNVVPNKIYNDMDMAIINCNEKYMLFNVAN